MMTSHQKMVTVDRLSLIKVLEEGLIQHQKEFAEAVAAYRSKILRDLDSALEDLTRADTAEDIKKVRVHFTFPPNYEAEYLEAIDMLSFSVEDTIQLDQSTFKAYVKNEWAWTNQFKTLAASYIS